MEAMLKQPTVQGTITEDRWNSLHTIDELDSALKQIIQKHFHE